MAKAEKKKLSGRKRDERVAAYIFVAPAVILLIAFLVVPMIYTVYFSGFKYQIMRPDAMKFIGFENYQKLFSDKNFWLALKNTVYFTVIVVPCQCVLALALALLVSKKFRGVAVFRTMYFAPQLTSMVVISVLWSVLYNANPNTGLINSILVSLGMSPIKFLSDASTAMNSIIFMSAWQGAGYQMMIFLAGLQGIPRDQYEAASVDGATKFKQFLYITIPGLKGTIKYVIMITMIQAMKLFTQPYIMTQGGPKNSTKTLVYYIYTQGFQKGNFGYACSIAAVFFVIVVCMSMAMKKVTAATEDINMKKSMRFSNAFGKFMFYFGNIIIGIIFVSPLIWMISASLKPEAKIFANMDSLTTFLPVQASLSNYAEVFSRLNMPLVFKNTLLYIALILVLDLLVNSMCGYALAKFEFKGKGAVLNLVIALMVLPMEAIMLPLYIEMSQLGWVNTLAALVIPFVAKCFSIYMFRQFFCDVPDDLIEAAAIDGCSPIRTFFQIVMPISKTVYATVFILDFVAHWNDFMWPFLVMTGEDKRTIQLAVQSFFGTQPVHYSAIMAALVVSAIPMIIMFIFMQKYYVEGIASSGIKG